MYQPPQEKRCTRHDHVTYVWETIGAIALSLLIAAAVLDILYQALLELRQAG